MKMKAKAKASGDPNYEKPETGNQAAVLVAIVELGTVKKEYKGEKYESNELYFVWELVTQTDSDAQRPLIGRTYSVSFSAKSNLRKMIEKWRGKPLADGEEFDLAVLLGKSCLLDVGESQDGQYARLAPVCVSALPKGMACPAATRKPVMWEIAGKKNLPEHLELPWIYGESVQDRILRSQEWRSRNSGATAGQPAMAASSAPSDSLEEAPF